MQLKYSNLIMIMEVLYYTIVNYKQSLVRLTSISLYKSYYVVKCSCLLLISSIVTDRDGLSWRRLKNYHLLADHWKTKLLVCLLFVAQHVWKTDSSTVCRGNLYVSSLHSIAFIENGKEFSRFKLFIWLSWEE